MRVIHRNKMITKGMQMMKIQKFTRKQYEFEFEFEFAVIINEIKTFVNILIFFIFQGNNNK